MVEFQNRVQVQNTLTSYLAMDTVPVLSKCSKASAYCRRRLAYNQDCRR